LRANEVSGKPPLKGGDFLCERDRCVKKKSGTRGDGPGRGKPKRYADKKMTGKVKKSQSKAKEDQIGRGCPMRLSK